MSDLTAAERQKRIGDVIRVASGSFFEQYDFFVYGYHAAYIGVGDAMRRGDARRQS